MTHRLPELLRIHSDPVENLAAINASVLHRFYKNPSVSVTTRADPLCAEIHYDGELVCWASCVNNKVVIASPDCRFAIGGMTGPEAIVFICEVLDGHGNT